MLKRVIAEVFGTFLLVFFGLGVVHTAVLTGAQVGLWQVAVVWGMAVALAISCVGSISGAHINPAITLALCCFGRHRKADAVPYIAGQCVGAFAAAATLFCLFSGQLAAKEAEKQVVRGEPGSVVTAMCYGEYFPNPGGMATAEGPYDPAVFEAAKARVSLLQALLAEAIGTMILAFVVFSLTDPKRAEPYSPAAVAIMIGATIAALISVIAPLTQAGFNPARDFGPRLFAWLAGWGSVAWPIADDFSWLTVYILAPIIGALAGAAIYEVCLRSGHDEE